MWRDSCPTPRGLRSPTAHGPHNFSSMVGQRSSWRAHRRPYVATSISHTPSTGAAATKRPKDESAPAPASRSFAIALVPNCGCMHYTRPFKVARGCTWQELARLCAERLGSKLQKGESIALCLASDGRPLSTFAELERAAANAAVRMVLRTAVLQSFPKAQIRQRHPSWRPARWQERR